MPHFVDAHVMRILSEVLSGNYEADADTGDLVIHFRTCCLPHGMAGAAYLIRDELWILIDLDSPNTFRHMRAMLREKALDLGLCLDPREDNGSIEVIDEPDPEHPHLMRLARDPGYAPA